ncbi:MAG: livG [Sphingomonas bacterium]|nr:livG [Sphingomonas bacterium]
MICLENSTAAVRMHEATVVDRSPASVSDGAFSSSREASGFLQIDNVHVGFGGVAALDGVTFSPTEGVITGIIGPNGAGKTTLFNCINGLIAIDRGAISLGGTRLDGLPPHRVTRSGISRTFQNLGLFPSMTVLENMMLGGLPRARIGFLSAAFQARAIARGERELEGRARRLLEDVSLGHLADVTVGALPFGTMKRIELARALMSSPRLLLLDEPAGGLSHGEVDEFAALIRRLHRTYGLTILLIEHHMGLVMGLCEHVVVLHLGKTLAEGRPAAIRQNPHVIAAYLGTPK